MKRSVLILLIISIALVIIGTLLMTIGFKEFDINKYSGSNKIVQKEYEINETIENINIDVETSDINIIKSNINKVECFENEDLYHKVTVSENTLNIELVDERSAKKFFFGSSNFTINIYLKEETLNELNIDLSTGDIKINENLSFNNIDIKVSTGNIFAKCIVNDAMIIKGTTGDVKLNNLNPNYLEIETSTGKVEVNNSKVDTTLKIKTTTGKCSLENIECNDLVIEATTGKTYLNNVNASESINITKGTGDVIFTNIDSPNIKIKATTGDIKGSVKTAKSFYAHTTTGKVSVPKTTGSVCEIETTTGDIEITISE